MVVIDFYSANHMALDLAHILCVQNKEATVASYTIGMAFLTGQLALASRSNASCSNRISHQAVVLLDLASTFQCNLKWEWDQKSVCR